MWIDRKTDKLPADILNHIVRLAQLGRAVGIHLVITTQRPSSRVILGIIKGEFPTRMAFRAISKHDSNTILGHQGAERLVVTTQMGSVSNLQRNLGIGYVKAGRLATQLEAADIVGPQEGGKTRKVLVRTIEELERMLKAYNEPEPVIDEPSY